MENMYLATFSKVVLIVSTLLLSLHSNLLFAQTSQGIQTISHQGVLVNESGEPVDDGAYIFTFRIYDTDTEGDHLWRETQVLQVQNGVFNAQLGSEDQLDIPFDRPYWLGIEIDGGEQLAPRMPLSAAPYALHAYSVADRSLTGASLADDALIEGDNISIERNSDGDFVVSAIAPDGGLTSVSVDSTMIGDGTNDQPLGISLPDNYISGNQLRDDISIETSGSIQTESTISSQEGIEVTGNLDIDGQINTTGHVLLNTDASSNIAYVIFRGTGPAGNPRLFHREDHDRIAFSGMGEVAIDGDLMVTGAKNFIHPHPHDPSKQIRYTSLEAGESGVYWRGSAVTQNGRAVIELPEHFTLVAHEENLTATITPVGSWAPLFVEEVTNTTLVVALDDRFGDADTEFDFVIHGIRDGFEDYEVFEERSMQLMD